MPLKAIPTEYKGVPMRSRLETKFAALFDRYGIPWQYEEQGYDLDGTWYLPDFYLPQQPCFVEIKPDLALIDDASMHKILLLAAHAWSEWTSVAIFCHPQPTETGHILGHTVQAVEVRNVPLGAYFPQDRFPCDALILRIYENTASIMQCDLCGRHYLVTFGNYGYCDCTSWSKVPQPEAFYSCHIVKEEPLPGARSNARPDWPGKGLQYCFADGHVTCLGTPLGERRDDGVFPPAL